MPSSNKKFNWIKGNEWPFWYTRYKFLRAPLKATKYWLDNFRGFLRRGRFGWSYGDVWNIDMYLGKIIPEMLQYLAEKGCSCPMEYIDKYENDEDAAFNAWRNDLNRCAKLIEFAASDRDDYNKYHDNYWNEDLTTNDVWREQYWQEDRLLYKQQEDAIQKAFNWLGKKFFELWD